MGWRSVEWGLAQISSKELSEWRAIFEIEHEEQQTAQREADAAAKANANKPSRQGFVNGT